MSTARLRTTVGELPALSGSIVESIRGNWSGTFGVHSETAPDVGSAASVVFRREDGTEDTFVGSVRRRSRSAGSVALSVTIVGGAGKLLEELPPRDHAPGVTEIPAGLIVKGLVDDAGEQLAAGVEAAADALQVHRWTRIAMPGGDALDLLVDALGGWGWRVQRDGTIWAGPETWAALDATKFLNAIPDEGAAVYACDGAPIRPGVTLTTPEGEIRVVEVVYTLASGSTRATVRPAVAGDPPPARGSRQLYLATYAATVREQLDDGSLVLVPDDPRLGDDARPLRGVPFRCGIPGAVVSLQNPNGERVRVGFESADPRGVFASAINEDRDPIAGLASTETGALARVGDDVFCGYWSVVPFGGGYQLAEVFAPGPGIAAISGRITTGSPEIKIRGST